MSALDAALVEAQAELPCALLPFVRRSRLAKAERQFEGACRELRRVEALRAEAEITLQLIASHPHGGLLSNIARVKLERLENGGEAK